MLLYQVSEEDGDTDCESNGKEARQEERGLEDQELTKKGSEKLDKIQERMRSRQPMKKGLTIIIINFQVF